MSKLQTLFGTNKPIVALLHIRELPGDPNYRRGARMDTVIDHARQELHALQDGGVDAVLFSNEFSLPYLDHLDHVTTAAMARVIGELRSDIKVPFGVHAISDPFATLDLAAAVECSFVRSVFSGAYVGESGIRSKNAGLFLRRKRELDLDDLLMIYMINAESDGDLSGRDMVTTAMAVQFKCAPDVIGISGLHAGHGADDDLVLQLQKAVPGVPIFHNTGCKTENIAEKLRYADGACVGTAFKKDGKFDNFVDVARVTAFMEATRKARGDL